MHSHWCKAVLPLTSSVRLKCFSMELYLLCTHSRAKQYLCPPCVCVQTLQGKAVLVSTLCLCGNTSGQSRNLCPPCVCVETLQGKAELVPTLCLSVWKHFRAKQYLCPSCVCLCANTSVWCHSHTLTSGESSTCANLVSVCVCKHFRAKQYLCPPCVGVVTRARNSQIIFSCPGDK